jgi:hypothetical protein
MDDRHPAPAPVRGEVEKVGEAPRLLDADLQAGLPLFLGPLLLALLHDDGRAAEGEGNGFGLDDARVRVIAGGEPAAARAAAAGRAPLPLLFAQQELREALRERQLADAGSAVDEEGVRQPVELAGELFPGVFLKCIDSYINRIRSVSQLQP